jgi:hypothetical protein
MDKTTHTAYVWKADRRTKAGERLVSTTVWRDRDALTVIKEVEAVWPQGKFRVEVVPTMKTVRNLMTGVDIEIPHDTPRACDPSSELYWSM